MRVFFYLTLIFQLLTCSISLGQDALFTQFNQSPLFLNPAYAGTSPQQRVSLISRLQWPNLPNAWTTTVLSYDFNYYQLNSGFGAYLYHDAAGSLGWRQTTVNLVYSYAITINDSWVLRPGIGFGYGVQNLGNLGSFNGTGSEVNPGLPNVNVSGSRGFFDFSSGILLYNKSFWLGASIFHFNEPNVAFTDINVDRIDQKLHIHGGYKFSLYNGTFRRARVPRLAPSFLYRSQGAFDQLDLGVNFEYNPIQLGVWYRGVPIFDGILNNRSEDAISFLAGIRFQKLEVGYSYDFTVSSLGPSAGGAHELSLVYQFVYKSAPKPNRKPIACPSFANSLLDEFKY